jgi:anti-sigma regulatory factor (Ser/Thr protein kinase)
MNSKSQNRQSATLQNKIAECEKLVDLWTNYAKSNNIPDDIKNDLRLATEEIFANIINYAHKSDDIQSVDIEFSSNTDSISITFTDTGIAFNPIVNCNKDIEQDDHCEGGMGIHLIMSLTDHQEYNRINQHNVFTVTKYYTKK